MKKILLLLATFASLAFAASAEDKLIYEYNFSDFDAGPYPYVFINDLKSYSNGEYSGNFDDTYGLITVQTNSAGNSPYGLQILDLGTAEGKVLCLNCENSGLGQILGFDVPETASKNPFYYLNFHLGKSTEALTGKSLRVEAQYAILNGSSATQKAEIISKIYLRNFGGYVAGGETVGTLANYNQQSSENSAALTNWVKYRTEFNLGSNNTNAPYRFCFQINNGGTINGRAFLFKSIKLTVIDEIDNVYASGKSETVAFGNIVAVPSTAWTPTYDFDTKKISFANDYNNEVLEYAVAYYDNSKDKTLELLNNTVASIKDYAAVSNDTELFTANDDGTYTVNTSASVLSKDGYNALVAVRVKAGANGVVVGNAWFDYTTLTKGTLEGVTVAMPQILDENGKELSSTVSANTNILIKSAEGTFLHLKEVDYGDAGQNARRRAEELSSSEWTNIGSNTYTYTLKTDKQLLIKVVDALDNESQQLEIAINNGSLIVTGVNSIVIDNENAPVEYFNLQGVRVANPQNGIYIRRQGGKASKVVIR